MTNVCVAPAPEDGGVCSLCAQSEPLCMCDAPLDLEWVLTRSGEKMTLALGFEKQLSDLETTLGVIAESMARYFCGISDDVWDRR